MLRLPDFRERGVSCLFDYSIRVQRCMVEPAMELLVTWKQLVSARRRLKKRRPSIFFQFIPAVGKHSLNSVYVTFGFCASGLTSLHRLSHTETSLLVLASSKRPRR